MKIVVGTANLESDYGYKANRLPWTDFRKILEVSENLGGIFLDTAPSYGGYEKLKNIGKAYTSVQILTKFKIADMLSFGDLERFILNSLDFFKIDCINTLYVHDSRPTSWKFYEGFAEELKEARTKGLIDNFGFSVYRPIDILTAKTMDFTSDVFQVPINLAQMRFDFIRNSQVGYASNLDARSVFLQGMVFEQTELRKALGTQFIEELEKLQNRTRLSILELSISLLNALSIKRAVFGFDSLDEFNSLIGALETTSNIEPDFFFGLKNSIPREIDLRYEIKK